MYDSNSPFQYVTWLNKAFLEVIKKTISTIEKVGLYKNIHFFITFKTNQGSVKLPNYLKKQYPQTMTIVLQNQFYNLKTTKTGFSVTLYFKSKPEELFIPWANITQLIEPVTPLTLKLSDTGDTPPSNSEVQVIKFPKQED